MEAGYKALRGALDDQIKEIMDQVADKWDIPSLREELIKTNRDFQTAKLTNQYAEGGAERDLGNNRISPMTWMTGLAGFIGASSGHTTLGRAALGAGAALGTYGAKTYGPGILGRGAYEVGKAAAMANQAPVLTGALGAAMAKRRGSLEIRNQKAGE